MNYKAYAERITLQIFERDPAFFLESGANAEAGEVLKIYGTYGGIRYPVKHESITHLEIILEASDLYTVKVKRQKAVNLENVISLNTKKPVKQTMTVDEMKVERVFLFDLIEVLHSLFYRDGVL